jgi:hypothetical protein
MHARVTLTRVIRQYQDVIVPNVESVQDADAQVAEALDDPLARARLTKAGSAWYSTDEPLVEAVAVAEIVESKTGVL